MSWSRRYPWPLDRDPEAIPQNVRQGVIVRSPMICRPHMREWLEKRPGSYPPPICSNHVWKVIDGQSFQLTAPRGPIRETSTHMVHGHFQLWMSFDGPPTVDVWSIDEGWDQPLLIPRKQNLILNPEEKELEDA